MRVVDPILMELEQEAIATRRLLERVPDDKLSWKPHPKSMSLGQLALHIAGVPATISGMAQQDTFAIVGFSQSEPASRKELLATFEESLRTAKERIGGMGDDRVTETWRATRNGKELMAMPRIAVLRAILLNHWYHHRGQLTVYLRMLEVPLPSVYGPTADENPFA